VGENDRRGGGVEGGGRGEGRGGRGGGGGGGGGEQQKATDSHIKGRSVISVLYLKFCFVTSLLLSFRVFWDMTFRLW